MNRTPQVVVIDDDRGIREILDLALCAEGYGVACARNGADGLELVLTREADVVLVDLKMPDVDGAEFCRRYAERGEEQAQVILMTAGGSRAAAMGLPGVAEVVEKPFDLDALLRMVARLVVVSRGRRAPGAGLPNPDSSRA